MSVGFSAVGPPGALGGLRDLVPSEPPGAHDDWVRFVRERDGACPEPNEFDIGEDNASGVTSFLSLEEVRERYRWLKAETDGALLPVASDVCGNYVCLGLGARRAGVCFWDHETGRVDPVADSFTAFLEALRPFGPDSVALEPDQVISAWIDPELLAAERKKD